MSPLCRILILQLLLISLLSCTEDNSIDTNENDTNQIEIHYGSFGGLCAYRDSLTITSNLNLHFDSVDQCSDRQFEQKTMIADTDFDELVSLYSFLEFQQLSLNSCDRCVDGLDTYLHIINNDLSHRILFGFNDDVRTMQALIDRLNDIREEQMQ